MSVHHSGKVGGFTASEIHLWRGDRSLVIEIKLKMKKYQTNGTTKLL